MRPEDQAQVIGLCGKCFYRLSHLTSPKEGLSSKQWKVGTAKNTDKEKLLHTEGEAQIGSILIGNIMEILQPIKPEQRCGPTAPIFHPPPPK